MMIIDMPNSFCCLFLFRMLKNSIRNFQFLRLEESYAHHLSCSREDKASHGDMRRIPSADYERYLDTGRQQQAVRLGHPIQAACC